MREEPLKYKWYDQLSTVKIAAHRKIKTCSCEINGFMQTIWKLLKSIAILLKAQKYKTSTLPILHIFQIKHKGGKATNQRCGWLLKYTCIIKYYHPSSGLPPNCFLKRPVQSVCPLETYYSRKHSVNKTPHEISPSSALGSELGHTEVTIAPRRMPAWSHLLPKWLEVASVSNFVSALLVLLLWRK